MPVSSRHRRNGRRWIVGAVALGPEVDVAGRLHVAAHHGAHPVRVPRFERRDRLAIVTTRALARGRERVLPMMTRDPLKMNVC